MVPATHDKYHTIRLSAELEDGLLGRLDAVGGVVAAGVRADRERLALAEVEDREHDVAVLVGLADLELVEPEDPPGHGHLARRLAHRAREVLVLGLRAPAAGARAGNEEALERAVGITDAELLALGVGHRADGQRTVLDLLADGVELRLPLRGVFFRSVPHAGRQPTRRADINASRCKSGTAAPRRRAFPWSSRR